MLGARHGRRVPTRHESRQWALFGTIGLGGMERVKGSIVAARLRFVRERFGEDALRELIGDLSPLHRRQVEARILPHRWVPFDLYLEVSLAIDRRFGQGDLALCREMGRFSADVNIPTLYRAFVRLGTPTFILRTAARLWDLHFRSGRLRVSPLGERGLTLRIEAFESPHPAHCRGVLGWAERFAELSAATVTRAEEVACRTEGDDACVMELEWQA